MMFQFSHPIWLLSLVVVLPWVVWLSWKSDVRIAGWRHWSAMAVRILVVTALCLGLAGLQWKKPLEGMNLFFLLDRSESIPSSQQEVARSYVNKVSAQKPKGDKAGVLVFGRDASIESTPNESVDLQKIQAIVGVERTDIAAALRLGVAAFPETGQKRMVLISDGNENLGDAMAAMSSTRGVSLDVIPVGVKRGNDVSIRKLAIPSTAKQGQPFDVRIFAQSDSAQSATVRLFQNDQFMGETKVDLSPGKNLFTFPQVLDEPGFYSYNVQLEAAGDTIPQNNRATSFVNVRGNPRVLIVSSRPEQEGALAGALKGGLFEVKLTGLDRLPHTLAEMQSYDAIFLCNVSAGDMGMDTMRLLESAVRDFGVGLICIGGDQAFAAGSYRGTPLESALPVDMELSSKKVLPSGAMVIVCHATEFPNGNEWARSIAFAALEALGPQDELGLNLWDGSGKWLFPLAKVGDKSEMGRLIAGMNPGDMADFQQPMQMAYEALSKSTANLKHIVVFSDGDPGAPSEALIQAIVGSKITISTVMIGGHVTPETMVHMADEGRGQFYDVRSPDQLPQIFIKEAAVILKSAIFEEPFKPTMQVSTELVKGFAPAELPTLRGYVCTTPKPRAEVPLVTHKGDPLLAHWQYGLGRTVAFTSDAKSKWAGDWVQWAKYRQFWTQVAQWSLRRVDVTDFSTEVSTEKGEGRISVEAIDLQGNYRNFLNLQTVVVGPKGEKQRIHLEQTGPGHYEARFPTRDVGAYVMNLMNMEGDKMRGSQTLGLSVNYSPEFDDPEPNANLLRRLAEISGGKVLDPDVDNPFKHNRIKTFQPQDLWEWLLKLAVILFPLDVAIRRIQIDREEWAKATRSLRRILFFWRPEKKAPQADESLAALLNRRDRVRSTQTGPAEVKADLFEPATPVVIPDRITRPDESSGQPAQSGQPQPLRQPEAGSETSPKGETKPSVSTTSRLLDAKRRARKKID
jgi:uncharacterized membrane protein